MEREIEYLIVCVLVVLAILAFVFIPQYQEGDRIKDVTSSYACEKYCPFECECFFRSGECRVSMAC